MPVWIRCKLAKYCELAFDGGIREKGCSLAVISPRLCLSPSGFSLKTGRIVIPSGGRGGYKELHAISFLNHEGVSPSALSAFALTFGVQSPCAHDRGLSPKMVPRFIVVVDGPQ